MSEDEWGPDRWWRAIGPDGSLWCESSNEQDVRSRMRKGDTLQRLYTKTEYVWREVAP